MPSPLPHTQPPARSPTQQAYKTYRLGGEVSELLYSPAAYGIDLSSLKDMVRALNRASWAWLEPLEGGASGLPLVTLQPTALFALAPPPSISNPADQAARAGGPHAVRAAQHAVDAGRPSGDCAHRHRAG